MIDTKTDTTELYEAVARSIRTADAQAGNLFLKRFLGGMERWLTKTRQIATGELPKLDDPLTIREDLLQYLLGQVGLTRDMRDLFTGLAPSQLRRLIMLAVPMWRQRGTPGGVVNTTYRLTGLPSVYRDWFEMRSILGESIVGEEQRGHDLGSLGDDLSGLDEYTSMLEVMDPGTLDADLLLRLVNLHRPANETVDVVIYDFLDTFADESSLGMWTTGDGTPEPEITEQLALKLVNGALQIPSVPGMTADQAKSFCLSLRFSGTTTGSILVVRFFAESDTKACRLSLSFNSDNEATMLIGGVTISSPPPVPLVPGVEYVLRVTAHRRTSDIVVTVLVDSCVWFSGTVPCDADAPAFGFFTLGMSDEDEGGAVLVDNVEFSRLPARCARVSPNSISKTF